MVASVAKRDGKWPPLYAWQPLRTSTSMKRALRSLLREQANAAINKSTLQALRARGLVDQSGALTETGAVYAISLCPLHEQAARLGITFREESIPRSNSRPEFDLLQSYQDRGWSGCFTEGGVVFVLLYSIWFDTLLKYAKYAMREWRSDKRRVVQVEMMYDNSSTV